MVAIQRPTARTPKGPGLEDAMSHRLHLFKSKIHRATVTHADLDYEGSVTISGELLDAAQILEHEQVHVWNVTRGTRLVTYALRGDADSGVICINGAAAHLAKPGDKVIIATFAEVEAEAARSWQPTVVFVDDANRASAVTHGADAEVPGPRRRLSFAG
jgi:aspartate 1-decarboxylase